MLCGAVLCCGCGFGCDCGCAQRSLVRDLRLASVVVNETEETSGRLKTTMWGAAKDAVTPLHIDVVYVRPFALFVCLFCVRFLFICDDVM